MEQMNTSTPEQKLRVQVDSDLEELIPGFLNNRQKDVSQIENLLNAGDFATIKRIGHTMKGACGGYGFDRLSEIGREIEKAAATEDKTEIQKYLREIVTYLKQVEIVYV